MACSNHPSSSEMDELMRLAGWSHWNLMTRYLTSARVGVPQATGKFAEYIALMNQPAFDLNFHSHNFPIFDSISTTRICSIKTHSVGIQETEVNVNAYAADFREMIGAREPTKFETAAQSLFAARHILPVPPMVREATSVDTVRTFLAQQAQMQVPAEHVGLVQNALRHSITRDPGLYNLPPAQLSPGMIAAIVARVVPI